MTMRIAFITAGAAGMFCGSCMRDNTLAAALRARGHDALLIPTYTPIRTDETDVSQHRVFFGGINVFLQQKAWLFRHTPWLLDRLLDFPRLLRWVSRFASRTKYSDLYDLTHSMLRGRHGKQRKELAKLTAWLSSDAKPEVVLLTNALLSGLVFDIKQTLGVPVIVTLQGDDVFLDAFEPKLRQTLVGQIRGNDAAVDGYICTSAAYADHMANYLGIDRAKMHVVHPGINLTGYSADRTPRTDPPLTIGYFARICREKGFHNVVDAFIALRQTPDAPHAKLKASGWLGENDRPFFAEQVAKLTAAGLSADFEHVECPDHSTKAAFFQSIDVFSVPAAFHEPKGLYVLEAWANGVPVVQPRRGAFPELLAATGGGLLVEPDTASLAAGLRRILEDAELRKQLGDAGAKGVRETFTADVMAEKTAAILHQFAILTP